MASPFLERTLTPREKHRRVEPLRKALPAETSVFGLLFVVVDDRGERRDALVVAAQLHHSDTLGRPTRAANAVHWHPDHCSRSRDEHDLISVPDDTRANEI